MNGRARGFSLVELLVVSVLLVIVMGAVYQTLISQQGASRHLSAVVNTQQTNRTTSAFLTSELREVGTRLAGDVTMASADSIRFTAMRKVGFICAIAAPQLDVAVFGDPLTNTDTLVIYNDKGTQTLSDDAVIRTAVTSVTGAASVGACPPAVAGGPWGSGIYRTQHISVTGGTDLSSVSTGAAIRSYAQVTYGHYAKGSDVVFGRRVPGDTVVTLIGPLAAGSNGLVLQYFDGSGTAIATPVSAGNLASISRVRILVRGMSKGALTKTATYTAPLVTDIALRGN